MKCQITTITIEWNASFFRLKIFSFVVNFSLDDFDAKQLFKLVNLENFLLDKMVIIHVFFEDFLFFRHEIAIRADIL